MENKQTDANASLEQFGYKQELKRTLNLPKVVLFGLAYLAPCTIFSTYGLVNASTHGMLALAYVAATVGMLFTAFSYKRMVGAFPIAGSVYTYVSKSISPHLGFLSGWAILLDYILLPMINFLICGLYFPLLVPVPSWTVTLGLIIICTFIVAKGIGLTSLIDNIGVIWQAVFLFAVIICAIALICRTDGLSFSASGLYNSTEWSNVGMAGILGGSSVLCLSFLGFDSVTTLSEETLNPTKTIGNALIIICLVAGGVFVLASLVFQSAWPTAWVDIADPDTGAFDLIGYVGGTFMASLFCATAILGCGASAIASMTSAARILYGMGRDGILPTKFFGHVGKKSKVPDYNTYLIGIISLSALLLNLDLGTSLINFGALLGFTLVNVSVIVFYFIKKKERNGSAIIKYLILPIIGGIICMSIWLNLDARSLTLGGCWLAVGFVYLLIKTKGFKKIPPKMTM